MFSPRWRKVLRDLSWNRGRTLLVVMAITVGVAATGSILNAFSVMTREMDRNYMGTNPASAILRIDGVDAELVAAVQARPEIVSAEARREVTGRLALGSDEWIDLQLVVVPDFNDQTVSRFESDSGGWNPASDEILIERSSLTEVDLAIGEEITVTMPGESPRALSVTGFVHDPGRTPAWMAGIVVGYITPGGLATLGLDPVLDELRIVTAGENDRAGNRRIAAALRAELLAEEIVVSRVDVPVPGEHPAQSVMKTLLFLLQTFGALTLVASGALVATLITAQMKQQAREIGVMKAIGARDGQVAGIYLGTVAILGVIGLVIGIPLGILGARGFIGFSFGLLNFEVASYRLDAWIMPLQVVAGLGVPLLAALYPVTRISRLPVREVITDYGVAARSGIVDSGLGILGRVRWIGRTNMFGVRNAFRSRSRTLLTVLALSIGGAAFMVALNTGAAWDRAVDDEFEARRYSAEVQLDRAYGVQEIARSLEGVPGVDVFETWNHFTAAMQLPEGGAGDAFRLLIPPESTGMIDYPLLEGRWLRPGDENALVVTQFIDDPVPSVGESVDIEIDGLSSTWTVVGIVRQLSGGQGGVAYGSNLPESSGSDRPGPDGPANHIRFTGDSDPSTLVAVEERLAGADIGVAGVATAAAGREALEDHLLIIVGLLMIMAVLLSVVGGLGLIEAMSISVLERRRELGVMRAVGASTGKVLQVVLVESAVIAVLSWVVAVVLSVPATLLVESITGQMFFQAPLATSFSAPGVWIWLAIVTVLAAVASAIPALEAAETPVHQALAYE
ncbi:MAG: FtsX-like permease family protein [Dehalococcoidia bacterium]|jgi:putative ABC transport system permease protein|nr:FtsX-like permease family protein [Dehalococcoidia bacterium]